MKDLDSGLRAGAAEIVRRLAKAAERRFTRLVSLRPPATRNAADLAPVLVVTPQAPEGGAYDNTDSAHGQCATTCALFALSGLFVAATLASMALTILLIPLLIDRGVAAPTAAVILATLGISQLPGRLWLLQVRRESPNALLLTAPMLLQAVGLMLVAFLGPLAVALVGVVIFDAGTGLHTLARPWLIQQLYGVERAGILNGRMARSQSLARAAEPLLAAAAAALFKASVVFVALGTGLLLVPLAASLQRRAAQS